MVLTPTSRSCPETARHQDSNGLRLLSAGQGCSGRSCSKYSLLLLGQSCTGSINPALSPTILLGRGFHHVGNRARELENIDLICSNRHGIARTWIIGINSSLVQLRQHYSLHPALEGLKA